MENFIYEWLISSGWQVKNARFWSDILLYGIILVASVLLFYLLRYIVMNIVKKIVVSSKMRWDDALYKNKFFHLLCWIIPLLLLYHFSGLILSSHQFVFQTVDLVLRLLFIILFMLIIKSVFKSIETRYNEDETRKRSIKGIIQACIMVVYIITAIVIFSVSLGIPTSSVLTGLGAASAVLLLVFKDSIVGFVSGIQIASNDMVRLGDWIDIPPSGVDGEVIDITMITVKVRNWDNTIVSLPAYDLISKSFKNWRGMQELGIRRIKRSIFMDMHSVKYCSDEMLNRFRKIEYMEEYITEKQTQIDSYNSEHEVDKALVVNGRQQTNIGVFRMYVLRYLQNHPHVSKEGTLMVRQLQPTTTGIPLEIYIFTNTSAWLPYEDIQSDIFDHIIAAVPFFDLKIFQTFSDNLPIQQ